MQESWLGPDCSDKVSEGPQQNDFGHVVKKREAQGR